ncbi:LIM domain kinase 2 [Tachysurus ichikawai]
MDEQEDPCDSVCAGCRGRIQDAFHVKLHKDFWHNACFRHRRGAKIGSVTRTNSSNMPRTGRRTEMAVNQKFPDKLHISVDFLQLSSARTGKDRCRRERCADHWDIPRRRFSVHPDTQRLLVLPRLSTRARPVPQRL